MKKYIIIFRLNLVLILFAFIFGGISIDDILWMLAINIFFALEYK